MEDYAEAREFDNENQEIREGLDRAQKLLKQSRKRDYYKILGVGRWVWSPFFLVSFSIFFVIFFLSLSCLPNCLIIVFLHRSANKQEIIKAYRKLAQQWHPDNFQSEADKKEAEKRFIDIASAKEVLIDPGKCSSTISD